MDDQTTRIHAWWDALPDTNRQRMLDLDPGDDVPSDLVDDLVKATAVTAAYFTSAQSGPDGWSQSLALRRFLAKRRAERDAG